MYTQPTTSSIQAQMRNPTFFSTRRQLEQKLANLHKCKDLNELKQLHAQLYRLNLHNDPYIAPKLIASLSLNHHNISSALNVFNQVRNPNVHLYNTLIRAYVHNSQTKAAFGVFFDMQLDGVVPDNFTFPFLLKGCSGDGMLGLVKMVHAQIEKFGFWGDVFVPNSVVDCYMKCGGDGVFEGRKFFGLMGVRNVVSWNSFVGGLVKCGELVEARKVFDEMPVRDVVSWNTILDGYVKAGDMDGAFELFQRMPVRNVVSWSTMVSGYSKVGDMEMARVLFDRMPVKSVVPWTIIVSGYAEKGMAKEAMRLFEEMEVDGCKPDDGAIIGILAACAESGLLSLGKRVHHTIRRSRFVCRTNVCNALVDMYSKCGSLDEAMSVFNGMRKKDIVSWNAMIQGLAMHGHGKKALHLFSRMKREGYQPDKVTFVGVLCACTHTGLVDEGINYFYVMERDYGVVPQIEHYGCMVDLLGRGGRLKEAFNLVHSMPVKPNAIIWGTLLGACRNHNAVSFAEEVLDQLVKLEPSDPGNYSMLSNIFAAAGNWDNVASVRLRMQSTGIQKPPGASSIEVDGEVHEFTVCDKSHAKVDKIYQTIDNMYKDFEDVKHLAIA